MLFIQVERERYIWEGGPAGSLYVSSLGCPAAHVALLRSSKKCVFKFSVCVSLTEATRLATASDLSSLRRERPSSCQLLFRHRTKAARREKRNERNGLVKAKYFDLAFLFISQCNRKSRCTCNRFSLHRVVPPVLPLVDLVPRMVAAAAAAVCFPLSLYPPFPALRMQRRETLWVIFFPSFYYYYNFLYAFFCVYAEPVAEVRRSPCE